MKTCIACGMPMKNISDFAANDESKDYCVHCSRLMGKCNLLKKRRRALRNL
jgi:hypothetical protein